MIIYLIILIILVFMIISYIELIDQMYLEKMSQTGNYDLKKQIGVINNYPYWRLTTMATIVTSFIIITFFYYFNKNI